MKRRVTAILAVAFTWAAVGQGLTTARADDVPRMTKEELRARLGAPELVILDLRIGRDWQASDLKIKGAVREDPGDVAGWVEKYPKEKTIVTYCA
jgi:rhodanese-related sulfurtransferase